MNSNARCGRDLHVDILVAIVHSMRATTVLLVLLPMTVFIVHHWGLAPASFLLLLLLWMILLCYGHASFLRVMGLDDEPNVQSSGQQLHLEALGKDGLFRHGPRVQHQPPKGREGNHNAEKQCQNGHQKECPQQDQVPVLRQELMEACSFVFTAQQHFHHKEEEPQQKQIQGSYHQPWRQGCHVLSKGAPQKAVGIRVRNGRDDVPGRKCCEYPRDGHTNIEEQEKANPKWKAPIDVEFPNIQGLPQLHKFWRRPEKDAHLGCQKQGQ
mmetsp:Transcript_8253/g.20314  ORF Transcript_8253/g.20314 Transcript_8253/m.20314 type:complete len:268 (-) Transcript_8253:212-1015(-)